MSGGFGLPKLDFSPLAQLGTTLAEGVREQEKRAAIQGIQAPVGSAPFLQQLGQTLLRSGDVNGALAASRLIDAQNDRTYQRSIDDRNFKFQTSQAERSQANADRSFSAQQEGTKWDRIYRDRTDARQERQLTIAEQSAKQKDLNTKFMPSPTGVGVVAVPGGEADPAYIGAVEAAKQGAKNTQSQNPYSNGGKFTEGEGKSAGFADRMFENEKLIQPLEQQGTSRTEQMMEGSRVPGFVGSMFHSSDFKSYKAAKDNWIAAQLRKESGAAIGQGEYDQADRQYFPQPGDTARQIEEKRQRRRIATEAMAREGGGSYSPAYEFGERNAVQSRRPQAGAAGQSRMMPLDQIQEGQRFRRDGRVYRRVNGQDVPE